MRIVVANAQGSLVGGAESYLRDLVPALRARGHEVAFLYESCERRSQLLGDGTASDAWSVGELTRDEGLAAVARWGPDVLLVNGIHDVTLEERLLAAHPGVLFAHDYYGTCATGEKRVRFPTSAPCIRSLSPRCLPLNYVLGCGMRHPGRLVEAYRLQVRRRALLSRYRGILVASTHMREELARNGVARDRVAVNPLWPTGVAPAPEPPAPRPPTGRVTFLGRLTRLKGPAVALEAVILAARRLGAPLRLAVAGDGAAAATLAEAGKAHGHLDLLGWVDGGRKADLLSGSDAVILPSLWPEPFGLVGLEAGAVGTPAVAFDTGGVREWLVPGVSGELAEPFSARSLADALVRALGDRERHQRLRVEAWRNARRFTRERHVQVLEEVLERSVAGGERRGASR